MARIPAWNEYKILFYLTDLVVCVIEGKQIKIVFFKVSVREIPQTDK